MMGLAGDDSAWQAKMERIEQPKQPVPPGDFEQSSPSCTRQEYA